MNKGAGRKGRREGRERRKVSAGVGRRGGSGGGMTSRCGINLRDGHCAVAAEVAKGRLWVRGMFSG